jgi:hypothetical protein
LSTSTIQYPARNSFDSGNTPSVAGGPPLFDARTSFASPGVARPSALTSSPAFVSSLLSAIMKPIWAFRSSGDHELTW